MTITQFEISLDRTQIDLTITTASAATALRFWTDKTYKDYNDLIDLTTKLTGVATEVIVLTLADLGLSYFDGVYFIEVEDPTEIVASITADLTRYKECILNKLMIYSICDDCLLEESIPLINAQSLLNGLETSIEQGFVDELFNIVSSLNKYCSNDCVSCGQYKNVITNNYYTTNG